MRILLVEDDGMLGASLKKALENHAFGVDWVQDSETALTMVKDMDFSAVILDVNLPDMSGIELLKLWRQQKYKVPVMMLTARDTLVQKLEGFDNGADDYLVKPFDLEELLARVRALVRRSEGRTESVLCCGDIELDVSASAVRKMGQLQILTAKEFRVLKILMERAGKFVTKGTIEYVLYSSEDAVESNTVEVAVYHLRKKLGSDFIQTVRGVGYMVSA